MKSIEIKDGTTIVRILYYGGNPISLTVGERECLWQNEACICPTNPHIEIQPSPILFPHPGFKNSKTANYKRKFITGINWDMDTKRVV